MKPKKKTQRELIDEHADRIALLERTLVCQLDRSDDAIEANGIAIDRVEGRVSNKIKILNRTIQANRQESSNSNKILATGLSEMAEELRKLDERCEHRNRVNRDLFSSLQRRLGHVELENESRRECQDVQRRRIEDLEARVQRFEAMFEAMFRAFDKNI